MLELCMFCGDAVVVPGPRSTRRKGLCHRAECRKKALLFLKGEGLLTPEEEQEVLSWIPEPRSGETSGDRADGGSIC